MDSFESVMYKHNEDPSDSPFSFHPHLFDVCPLEIHILHCSDRHNQLGVYDRYRFGKYLRMHNFAFGSGAVDQVETRGLVDC